MNLLTKLGEKLKNVKDETKKRIIATILAGGIALSGLGMTGCTSCNPNPNDPNTSITNPGDDNGGTQTPGNNGGTQNGGSSQNDYSKYSQILQNVLTDEYYYGLISNANSHDENFVYNNQTYAPTPFAFLEDNGFNVTKIKNNQLYCSSELFSIGNDLYVEVKAEIEASTNYVANYILKYNLTEKEMSELGKLFTTLYHPSTSDATYFQASFFVQELSYLKTPEVKSVGYTTRDCNNSSLKFFDKKELIGSNHIGTYIKSEHVENSQTTYHYYIVRPYPFYAKSYSQIGLLKMHTAGFNEMIIDDKVIQADSTLDIGGKLTAENRTNFNNSITDITSYTSRDHYFKDLNNKNALESVFGK